MGRLLKAELLKMRYNKTIWVFWAVSVIFVALVSLLDSGSTWSLGIYGYTVSFTYIKMCGTFVVMFLAPIAGALFTQELRQGTMHNTLSCGVSRGRYFAVKAVCIFAIDLLVFLFCLVEFVCIRTALTGWLPQTYPYFYPNYGLVNIAYHFGTCLLLCTYIAFYILVAVCVKKPAVVYVSGAAATMGELTVMGYIPAYKGVFPVFLVMYDMAESRDVLTPEFFALFVPSIIMGIVFLVLAFLVFTKRDIN